MDIKRLKRDFERAKQNRQPWHPVWSLLREYVALVKQSFDNQTELPAFLTKEVFDSTGVFAAQSSASTLLGMLWPGSAAQAFEIVKPDDLEKPSTELVKFYERMTKRSHTAMDDPKANLALSLDEYMLDQMVIGTSGVGREERDDKGLLYRPYGVNELYVVEGKNGRVMGVFLFFEWEADRIVDEYGIENVSEKVRQKYNAGQNDAKFKILVSINSRREKKATKGKFAMPYEGIHIEFDSNKVLKEEGFRSLPIFPGRFRKLTYEKYGRSPAMNALPDIREANTLREAVIIATEKALSMPKGILDDGMLGGGIIDDSAGAINVFNASGNLQGKNPVFDIGTPPDLTTALARLEKLEQTISQHFSLDRLLDMNNEQQMTFGEAQIRNQIRKSSLSSLFSRQISEVFTPLIESSVEILWNNGTYGVVRGSPQEAEMLAKGIEPEYIPDELIERQKRGQDIYQIKYKTIAANAARAEEYMSVIDIMQLAVQGFQIDPTLAKRVNLHEGLKVVAEIRGVPSGIIRQDDEFEAIMEAEKQAQQQAMQLQAAQSMAATAKDAAQAKQAWTA